MKALNEKINFLKNKALNLRIDSIRATTASQSGHPTSCLSAADIIAAIFFNFLKYDIENPNNPNNDRFILSKGHAIPVVYAAWKHLGIINDKELLKLREFDSELEGHPTPRFKYNEAATGSLGQGLAIGAGMAINAKKENLNYKTYIMMGDGELSEGSIWEAAELASHYKLNNLIGIIDCNRLGQSGESINDHNTKKYAAKFNVFGWQTHIIDGHNIEEIVTTLQTILNNNTYKPTAIIAKTYKGYGLYDIEDKNGFHGKPFKIEELDKILNQLNQRFKQAAKYKNKTQYMPLKPNSHASIQKHSFTNLDIENDPNTSFFDLDKKIATRKAFGFALASLGKKNKNIFTIDGDVKNSTYTENFEKQVPENFIECFIAEQAMIGIATGLVLRNKIPFAATFGAFLTRAHDQIRMAGIGKNALRLCGSHCGVSIGEDGPSQMALEDISMMRSIPNSIVLYPSDGISAYKLTQLMSNYNQGISYIRTTRPATPNLYKKNEIFEIGKCKIIKKSKTDKVCVIAAGITLHESLKAYEELKKQNIYISIIDLYCIKPLDVEIIEKTAIQSNKKIITVEDHYPQGGIGEAISGVINNQTIQIEHLAVNKMPRSGKPEELLAYEQINAKAIINKILKFI
ncbi:transketolase [Candidatus Dependentiae bacterium]|nr:transketolase [Candidatus Dependentiae bacterium]